MERDKKRRRAFIKILKTFLMCCQRAFRSFLASIVFLVHILGTIFMFPVCISYHLWIKTPGFYKRKTIPLPKIIEAIKIKSIFLKNL
jgi:hypothetical protein